MSEKQKRVEIVFDGRPSPEGAIFIEVEQDGRSIRFGEWVDNGNGTASLVLPEPYAELATALERLERRRQKRGLHWRRGLE